MTARPGFTAATWREAPVFDGHCATPADVESAAAVFALSDTFNGLPLPIDKRTISDQEIEHGKNSHEQYNQIVCIRMSSEMSVNIAVSKNRFARTNGFLSLKSGSIFADNEKIP